MDFSAWIPRVVGVAGGWVAAWAAQKGLTLNSTEVSGVMLATYAFLHRAISKKVNPGDATKSVLIEEDKATVKTLDR